METGRLKQETTRNFCENSMSKVELNDKKEEKKYFERMGAVFLPNIQSQPVYNCSMYD